MDKMFRLARQDSYIHGPWLCKKGGTFFFYVYVLCDTYTYTHIFYMYTFITKPYISIYKNNRLYAFTL